MREDLLYYEIEEIHKCGEKKLFGKVQSFKSNGRRFNFSKDSFYHQSSQNSISREILEVPVPLIVRYVKDTVLILRFNWINIFTIPIESTDVVLHRKTVQTACDCTAFTRDWSRPDGECAT